MTPVEEVLDWIKSVTPGNQIAVDDGGLTLVELTPEGLQTGAYIEIGGIPSPTEGD